MEKISNNDFLELLKIALNDKNINHYEFKILVYIFNYDDFMVTDLKENLKITSFNMISKYIKNLINQDYIIKISKHIKNQKNKSSYQYFINTEKLHLQKNNNISQNSLFYNHWALYYYFFETIPTNKKINKDLNFKSIQLLLDFDNYDFTYLISLIDFISKDESLKNKYNRPTLLRKDIDQLITLFENNKGIKND